MKKKYFRYALLSSLCISLLLGIPSCGSSNQGSTMEGSSAVVETSSSSGESVSESESSSGSELPDNVILSDLSNAKDVIKNIYNLKSQQAATSPGQQDQGIETTPENPSIAVYDSVTIGDNIYLLTGINDFIGYSTLEKTDEGNYKLVNVTWGNSHIQNEVINPGGGTRHVLVYGYNPESSYGSLVLLVKDGNGEEQQFKYDLPQSGQYILECEMPDEKSSVYSYEVYDTEGNDVTDQFYEIAENQENTFTTAILAVE